MTTGVTAEIRIVRCPRCHHLLPELLEFTVYKCGGCDAVLQAKSRNTDISNLASEVQRNGCVQTNESVHVSDDKDLGTTSIDASFPSSCESLPCLNNETEQIQLDNHQLDNQDHLKPLNLGLNNEKELIESDDQCNLRNEIESIQSENDPETLEGDAAEKEFNDENLQLGEANEEGISSQIHPCSSPEQQEEPYDIEDTELEHNASELNEVLSDSPLYSARNFLADDSSIFSDDEKLDNISDHYRHSSRNTRKASIDDLHDEEMAVENNLFVRNMTKSRVTESETELERRSYLSNLSANNRYDMKGGKRDHDGVLDYYTNRLYRRSSQNRHGNMKISYPDSNDFSGERFFDPEDEKMNLLRLVNQMQQQLYLSCKFDRNGSRFGSGPSTWKIPREGILHDSYHSENLGRYSNVGYQPRQHKISQIPFSGDAMSSGLQHRSMPLHSDLLRFHHNDSCYSCCSSIQQSCLSSQYTSTQLEPIFYNQRSKNQEVDEFSRERYHMAKRHFRPIAGGAPFITCYNCFKPLQIPADFLLFKRRHHKLICGACSEVLEFFLQSKNHMIPCIDPPPSEIDEYSDEYYKPNRASMSDDYGLSFGKSYFNEGDASSGSIQSNARNSSDNPLYHNSEQVKGEFGSKLLPRTSKNPAPGLPLHKLMGYSSISRVISRSRRSKTRVRERN